jgi:hypothetical protein
MSTEEIIPKFSLFDDRGRQKTNIQYMGILTLCGKFVRNPEEWGLVSQLQPAIAGGWV